MTWWSWAVLAVLILYPVAVWVVLYCATPQPVDGELKSRGRVLHVWRDGAWHPVPPPVRDDPTLTFPLPEIGPRTAPRPMHCRDVWRPM